MSGPQRFKVKPIEVEAIQYTGIGDNWKDLIDWTDGAVLLKDGETRLRNEQTNGWMRFKVGDWIVKDAVGAFHALQQHVFDATYEAAKR